MSKIKKEGYLSGRDGEFPFRQFIVPKPDIDESHGQNNLDYNAGIGHWKRGRVSRNPPISTHAPSVRDIAPDAERNIQKAPYKGKRKPSLLMVFTSTPDHSRYECRLGKSITFTMAKSGKIWIGRVVFGKKLLFTHRDTDHKKVLAKLCGGRWFYYQDGQCWWSLYDVYRSISWHGLDKRTNGVPKEYVTELDARHVRGVWVFMKFQRHKRRIVRVSVPKAFSGATRTTPMPDARSEMGFSNDDPQKRLATRIIEAGTESLPSGEVVWAKRIRVVKAPANVHAGEQKQHPLPRITYEPEIESAGLYYRMKTGESGMI